MRYARLIAGYYPSLDRGRLYRVGPSELPAYVYLYGKGIGSAFVSPDRVTVLARDIETVEELDDLTER